MADAKKPVNDEYFRQRIAAVGGQSNLTLADPLGVSTLAHADFLPFEGLYGASPNLMLTLCTAHIGRMGRYCAQNQLEGVIRPGTFLLALPNTPAQGFWSKTQMLGISINLEKLTKMLEQVYLVDDLLPAATSLHTDTLISSVMTAMWRDAELHGLSSAFFEQGMMLLLDRLVGLDNKKPATKRSYQLNKIKLRRVLELIESRLEQDVTVSELAALAELDTRSFTRAFNATTGFSPYVYFTMRRMELAKRLMLETTQTITEISMQVGYSNPSKFSAAFRRICAIPPNTWRRDNS
ncbi:AraC family transcriptional regulator [Gammaproteobacteria bacterium AS21]